MNKNTSVKNALTGLETTGPMYLIASFQYSVRGKLGLIVRIHDETNGVLFHDFFDSIQWRRLRNGRWITGFGHERWLDFSFFVTLVSIVLGGTESLARNSTQYRVVKPWQNMVPAWVPCGLTVDIAIPATSFGV